MKTTRCIERKYKVELYFDDVYGQRYRICYEIIKNHKCIDFSLSMEYDNGSLEPDYKVLYKDSWFPKDTDHCNAVPYELTAFIGKAVEAVGPVYRKLTGSNIVDPFGMYNSTDFLMPPVRLIMVHVMNPSLINLTNTLKKIMTSEEKPMEDK